MFRKSNEILRDSFSVGGRRIPDDSRLLSMRSFKVIWFSGKFILGLMVCLLLVTGCQPNGTRSSDQIELKSGSANPTDGESAVAQPFMDNVQQSGLADPELALDRGVGKNETTDD